MSLQYHSSPTKCRVAGIYHFHHLTNFSVANSPTLSCAIFARNYSRLLNTWNHRSTTLITQLTARCAHWSMAEPSMLQSHAVPYSPIHGILACIPNPGFDRHSKNSGECVNKILTFLENVTASRVTGLTFIKQKIRWWNDSSWSSHSISPSPNFPLHTWKSSNST